METRAHFILIGLFTLLGLIGGLGFFLWLASVQIDRQYAQYGMLFDNVAGLDQSAEVLFNGVGVGRVVGIRIWEQDPRKVYVAVEIDAATPIAVDTVAQLASQGVTGVAYIALSAGSVGSDLLSAPSGEAPLITSRPSSLQSIVETTPELLVDAAALIKQLETITGPENQVKIDSILHNVETATAHLDTALSDFSTSLQATSELTSTFASRLDETLENTDAMIVTAHRILQQFDSFFATDVGPMIADARTALATATSGLRDLGRLGDEARTLIGAISQLVRNINRDPSGFLLDNRVPEYRR